tara:strand:+ start:17069 stop:17566 length:498 start_codon:yes stop_codon:yes gene_type:complete
MKTDFNYEMSQEVTNLLLNGGTMITNRQEPKKYDYLFTGLIRMARGYWVQDKREFMEGNTHEWVIVQNRKEINNGVITYWPIRVQSNNSGTMQELKKKMLAEHREQMDYIRIRQWNKEQRAMKAAKDLGECYNCDEPITNKDSSYCSTGCNEQEEKELHAESTSC